MASIARNVASSRAAATVAGYVSRTFGLELAMAFILHHNFPDETIRLIGLIAIETAYLDVFLGIALANLTGTSADLSNNTMFATDTRKKVGE